MSTSMHQGRGFNFDDLEPVEIPVGIRGVKYILREASSADARKWRNSILSSTKIVDGKVAGVGNVADSESLLVSLCLFPTDAFGKRMDKPVPLQYILELPNRLVKPLFEEAKRISDLDEKPDTKQELVAKIKELQEKLATLERLEAETSSSQDSLCHMGASEGQDPT